MATQIFNAGNQERAVRLGEFAREKRDLPWEEFCAEVSREATLLGVNITSSTAQTLRQQHQDHHDAIKREQQERERATLAYVRGPLRERHKLVVPMVVKAKPKFKKARTFRWP